MLCSFFCSVSRKKEVLFNYLIVFFNLVELSGKVDGRDGVDGFGDKDGLNRDGPVNNLDGVGHDGVVVESLVDDLDGGGHDGADVSRAPYVDHDLDQRRGGWAGHDGRGDNGSRDDGVWGVNRAGGDNWHGGNYRLDGFNDGADDRGEDSGDDLLQLLLKQGCGGGVGVGALDGSNDGFQLGVSSRLEGHGGGDGHDGNESNEQFHFYSEMCNVFIILILQLQNVFITIFKI